RLDVRVLRGCDGRDRAGVHPAAEVGADLDVADQLAVDCLAKQIIELGDGIFLRERRCTPAKAIVPVTARVWRAVRADSKDGRSGKQLDVGEDGPVGEKILEGKILDEPCLIDAGSDCRLRQQRLNL